MQECRTGLGSSSLERDLGILVDNKLNMSEHFAAAAKKGNRVLGYVNKGSTSRGYSTLHYLSGHTSNTVLSFGPCSLEKEGQAGVGPKEGHKDNQRIGELAIGGKTETTGFVWL